MIRTLSFAVIFTIMVADGAFAQSSKEAALSAVKYRPIPPGAVIQIQTLDNSEGNLILAEELTRAMRGKGFLLSDEGYLVLTIETRDEIGAWSTSGDSNVIEFQTTQGSGGTDDSELRVNLFDSTSGGLLSNSQSNPTTIVIPTQYVVDLSLDSRESGKRLWEGRISSELGQSNSQNLMERMIPVLANVFGLSVNRKVVPLP